MREVAAECERPVLLFSGGKDSAVLLRLAEKAFRPGRFPFPVMHVDTGHNFPGGDRLQRPARRRPRRKTPRRLRSGFDRPWPHGFDACIGGRRDEDKARAKERVLSFRDAFGRWDPRNQRPELWHLYHGRVRAGEHLRAFPLSDWTELDVWQYVAREGIELPSIYFSHRRQVLARDGLLLAVSPWVQPRRGEAVEGARVRFRTLGDATCTGAVRSRAATVEEVIAEVGASRVSERGTTRADDRFSENAMEDRKREGYL